MYTLLYWNISSSIRAHIPTPSAQSCVASQSTSTPTSLRVEFITSLISRLVLRCVRMCRFLHDLVSADDWERLSEIFLLSPYLMKFE